MKFIRRPKRFDRRALASFLMVLSICQVWAHATSVPHRVVTLTPALAEMAAEFSLDSIVGVVEYTDEPRDLLKRPKVGGYHRINRSAILNLKPDLVLASRDGNIESQIKALEKLGVKVLILDTGSMEKIATSYRALGRAFGQPDRGDKKAQAFMHRWDELKKRNQGKARATVLVQVGMNPLIVAGQKSYLTEALESLGYDNIFSQVERAYFQPQIQSIRDLRPHLILSFSTLENDQVISQGSPQSALESLGISRRELRDSRLLRPGPRFLDALAEAFP